MIHRNTQWNIIGFPINFVRSWKTQKLSIYILIQLRWIFVGKGKTVHLFCDVAMMIITNTYVIFLIFLCYWHSLLRIKHLFFYNSTKKKSYFVVLFHHTMCISQKLKCGLIETLFYNYYILHLNISQNIWSIRSKFKMYSHLFL